MSHPLAYANQSLYLANILLSGWRAELERGSAPQNQVNQAYASPVQTQLLDGYGWLLLAVCRIRQLPESPPRSVSDLPPLPTGLVRPAEAEACAQLEQSGWVAALKAPISDSPVVRHSDSLAIETGVDLAQFEDWAEQLAGLAETVADAIDES